MAPRIQQLQPKGSGEWDQQLRCTWHVEPSQPGIERTPISCIGRQILITVPPRKSSLMWSIGLLKAKWRAEYGENNTNLYLKTGRGHQEENTVSGVQKEKTMSLLVHCVKRTILSLDLYIQEETGVYQRILKRCYQVLNSYFVLQSRVISHGGI